MQTIPDSSGPPPPTYADGFEDGRHDAQVSYDDGYNDAREHGEPFRTAASALAGTVHEVLQRLSEPVPGHDDLDRVLRDLQSALADYVEQSED